MSAASTQALRDQIASTYARISQLSELEVARSEVFEAATASAGDREAEAVANVAERLSLLTAARVPALSSAKVSPEARLAAEVAVYRREEVERLAVIARHEDEIRAARAKIADAEKEYVNVTRSLQQLREHVKHREESEKKEAETLLAEREEAIALIAAESDAEARRVLSGIDDAVVAARAEAQATLDAEIQSAEGTVLQALNTYAATCRLRIKAVAGELGSAATAQQEAVVKPGLERLEAARLANMTAAAQLSHTRNRLAALHAAVASGRDPGDDIHGLAASFPLLPMADGLGGRRTLGGGPSSPSQSPDNSPATSPQARFSAGAGASPARGRASSASPLGRAPLSSPGGPLATTGRARSGSLLSPGGSPRETSSAASSSYAAMAQMGRAASSPPGTSRGAGGGAGGAGQSPSQQPSLAASHPALLDVLGTLEQRDAFSLGLTAARARRDLAGLLDRTASAWVSLGQDVGGHEAVLAFIRATQAALAQGAQPGLTSASPGKGPVGVDVPAAYKAECDSVAAMAGVWAARANLAAAQAAKAEAEKAMAAATGPAKVDAARALSAANAAVVQAVTALDKLAAQAQAGGRGRA